MALHLDNFAAKHGNVLKLVQKHILLKSVQQVPIVRNVK